ncbi:hypothetical protein GDO78_002669 [Eleutherodactylus coqui]|uniref:Uncharacterized protein n=1 Tax=Eleutherodactylus coqui TaxID=57060 RepID=A0A8J6EXV7_ELECQ|nr:hypothetical protein GDO78_002669 [Eleutherodactylus coqui]
MLYPKREKSTMRFMRNLNQLMKLKNLMERKRKLMKNMAGEKRFMRDMFMKKRKSIMKNKSMRKNNSIIRKKPMEKGNDIMKKVYCSSYLVNL